MIGLLALLAALSAAPPPTRLAQAEGVFPGTLVCSPGPGAGAGFRAGVTVEIDGGRARYTFPAAAASGQQGGSETGTGTLAPDRTLVLEGRARSGATSYTSRYSGKVGGRGGLLTGTQRWASGSRSCQITIGDGRG